MNINNGVKRREVTAQSYFIALKLRLEYSYHKLTKVTKLVTKLVTKVTKSINVGN